METAIALTAADIMRRDVVTIRTDWDIREAVRTFEEKRISGAPVLDAHGRLCGVLSTTDIAAAWTARAFDAENESDYYHDTRSKRLPAAFGIDPLTPVRVESVMCPVIYDAPEHTPVAKLASLMTTFHIHRVIITRAEAVVGIVSSLDLVRLLAKPAPAP